MLGIMTTVKARELAKSQGLDLVEISPNADPPVCRIMDFGKHRYDEKRQEKESRKRQHSLSLKEIKYHANVEDHDYLTKTNHVKEFLKKGHKVKISLYFRGRENAHRELGFQLVQRVQKDCEALAVADTTPRQVGRGLFMILSPRNTKGTKNEPAKAK